jgi:glycosyltransferase involved in cell wall biosynthesis
MTRETRRLALLLPDMSGGGAERVALALMRDFIARGHPVDLVLVNARGVLLPLVPPEVEIIDLGAATLRRAILPLVRYLRLRRPHALHAMMWPLTVIAVLARLVSRLPTRIVLSDHIALSKQYGGSARTMRAIRWSVRLLYPLADARVLVSASAADDLAAVSGLPRRAIEIVHNPLDLPAGLIRDRSAKDWGNDGPARIVTLGVLKAQKNYALLLHAFALVRARRAARLAIVGDGVLRPALERLAGELGIAGDVIFAGYDLDPWPWLASADVFALSSDYEGLPNVLVEALHAGLPVVSTDCKSGPREILDDGLHGHLVPCNDAVALAAAIEEALDHPHDPAAGRARAQALSGQTSVDRHVALMLGMPS